MDWFWIASVVYGMGAINEYGHLLYYRSQKEHKWHNKPNWGFVIRAILWFPIVILNLIYYWLNRDE